MHPIRLVSMVQSMAGACCECLCVCGMNFHFATTWRMYVWQGCGNVCSLDSYFFSFAFLSNVHILKLEKKNAHTQTHDDDRTSEWMNEPTNYDYWTRANSMKWEITWSILNISSSAAPWFLVWCTYQERLCYGIFIIAWDLLRFVNCLNYMQYSHI